MNRTRRNFLNMSALVAAGLALAPCLAQAQDKPTARKPNVILILADDLGWADVGFHGSAIRTPHLDRLASEGIELTRFYTCPVCSPTRTGVLTGRYPNRMGMHGSPTYFTDNKGLPPDEDTVAEVLGRAGYKHRHAIGKWHLGTAATVFHPLRNGFTGFYGHYCGQIDYWTHKQGGERDWHRDFESCADEGYSTHLMTREAVRVINTTPAGEPFFIYLAYNAPHYPNQAPADEVAKYAGVNLGPGQPPVDVYAAMVSVMDAGIGEVLAALERKGVANNTLVLFFSDNGGCGMTEGVRNPPFRDQKGTAYEGGIRAAALARWPAQWRGGRKVDALMGYVDVLPTLAAAAGYRYPPPKPLDGINLVDIIAGREAAPDRALYPDRGAVVTQRWKYINDELYDLAADAGETTNVAAQHLDVVARMQKQREYFLSLTGPKYVPPGFPPVKTSPPPKNWKMPDAAP